MTGGSADTNGSKLWPHGSSAFGPPGNFGSLGNVASLQSQVSAHRQLLQSRGGSGLDGVEVGPMLGRGSYGRVYKVPPSPAPNS